MTRCPFHEDSSGVEQKGDLSAIACPHCGNYRISNVALSQLQSQQAPPVGWPKAVARNRLISSRDTRALLAG